MSDDRFAPPATTVADVVPTGPRRSLSPWLAAALGVLVVQFLTNVVSEPIVLIVGAVLGSSHGGPGEPLLLVLDVLISGAFTLGTLVLLNARTRSPRGPFLVGAVLGLVAIDLAWRWLIVWNGWPVWYELLLLLNPIASAAWIWLRNRKEAAWAGAASAP